MADNIRHRGPDACGEYVDDQIGLSHRRLSIIDIETGGQPMSSADGQQVLVFNGEIFNYVELRKELEKEGIKFRTASDTEVVLELYRARGIDFVHDLNGQFAIALWDRDIQTLFLVRDRVGICPLFYTTDRGRLVFGSEIKGLIPVLKSRPSLSIESVSQIFTFWAPISPRTVFENVFEVPPGKILRAHAGNLELSDYWDWPVPKHEYSTRSEDDLAEELHAILVDATRIRLRADVAVGAYLSGGLDSSAIVSLILNHTDSRLRTFSLTFAEKEFDESRYQRELVNHAKVCHSELCVGQQEIGEHLRQTTWHTETPVLRTAPVPMGMLSAHVRQSGFKVVMTGEGADEVLGGYDIFKETKVREFWARQPQSNARPLLLKRLYPYLTLPRGKGAEYLKRFFGQGIDTPESVGFSHGPRWRTTGMAKKFFAAELRASLSPDTIQRYTDSLPAKLAETDYFNRAQYIESKSMMSGYLLSSQGDRMLMMNSVEGRFPFLDHRVIEFSSSLPPKLKMKVLCEKYLLKKAVDQYLPKSITRRHKQPYRAPDATGLGSSGSAPSILDALSRHSLERVGLFDPDKVGLLQNKAATHRHLSFAESQAITGIVTTQFVHDQFC